MGLTAESTWIGALKETVIESTCDFTIALAGNPNTGKSTVFNSLTGMNQHTGNWPGKTVTWAKGKYLYKDKNFLLVDLPGTYSLLSNSVEEEVARDFICFAKPNVTVVVADATCLERNLNLVLQILEITPNVIVCVNLIDEARRKKIRVNTKRLSSKLGVPVIATNARDGEGMEELKTIIYQMAKGKIHTNPVKVIYGEFVEKNIEILKSSFSIFDDIDSRWLSLRWIEKDDKFIKTLIGYYGKNTFSQVPRIFKKEQGFHQDKIQDEIVTSIVKKAEDIAKEVIIFEKQDYDSFDRKIDDILTSKIFGYPIMLLLLVGVFWITIFGANYPSEMLATAFFNLEEKLSFAFFNLGVPIIVHDILILGVYRTLAWVVSVMLPPMAIFFPLFTLLEDLGYLPRVAFNLDNFFKKAHAHGKQALTMCMGFGCNAAGIIACRIIDSPRERLIAVITNNFVPCNGRFPTLIALSSIFVGSYFMSKYRSLVAAVSMALTILLSIAITLVVSKILSKTILKGIPSSFTLELPPYRKPQVGRIILRSIFDRTLFVLARAVIVAAPAGFILWFMANIETSGISLLDKTAAFLHPFARLLGLDGYILMAFILGLPANEIVIPIIIMSYMSKGALLELDSFKSLGDLLISNGWTAVTAICTMIFTLNHFPCGTTLLTIKKETQSLKWTIISFMVPTVVGIVLCFLVAQTARLLGFA